MAEEITCPACETPNDPWNELCDACGAELYAEAEVAADADDEEFVAPEADGDPAGFEGVEQVQAYDEENPDDGFDADEIAGDEDEFAEVPVEANEEIHEVVAEGNNDEPPTVSYDLQEDTGVQAPAFAPEEADAGEAFEQFAAHEYDDESEDAEYELEAIEPADEDGEPFDASPDDTFDDWEEDDASDGDVEFNEDQVMADGGAPFEPAVAEETSSEIPADSEASFAEELAADSDAGFADDMTADSDADFDEFADADAPLDEVAEQSEVEEELPPPPELEAILNPERVERAPIEPLPTPGPYAELATLTVFKGGESLGEVAIDSNCTVLGLDHPDEAQQADEEAEEIYELEAIEPVEAEANEAPAEAEFELEAIEDEADAYSEDDFAAFSSQQVTDAEDADEDFDDGFESFGEEVDEEEEYPDSEVDEELPAPEPYEDPEDLEEGPVIDLSQFGDAERFARRHGYLFRQNKHYTLYVLSDKGTQINDEVLELGEYRELADGDVIVLGGEVALEFNEPAA